MDPLEPSGWMFLSLMPWGDMKISGGASQGPVGLDVSPWASAQEVEQVKRVYECVCFFWAPLETLLIILSSYS